MEEGCDHEWGDPEIELYSTGEIFEVQFCQLCGEEREDC